MAISSLVFPLPRLCMLVLNINIHATRMKVRYKALPCSPARLNSVMPFALLVKNSLSYNVSMILGKDIKSH